MPFNDDGVAEILEGVGDPVTRNLLSLCMAAARMRFMREQGLTASKWVARLPKAPFDMVFFASVLKQVFSKRDLLQRILNGESIASATGWDENA